MKRRWICGLRQLAVIFNVVTLSAWRLAAQSGAGPVTALPANAVVAIRTIDLIDSNGTASDKEYKATVDDSVVVSDVTLASVGTPAFLRVMRIQQSGAVKGRAEVSLRLVALEVNGQRVSLDTGNATIQSGSQAAKAAKGGAGGAVVGGILGALLGGKGGAAKGAAAGAAVGVTAAVVVGQRIHVPAETRLSFKLTRASQIQPLPVGSSNTAVSEGRAHPTDGPVAKLQSLIGLTETQVKTAIGSSSFTRQDTWYYDTPKGTLRVRFQNGVVTETLPADFDMTALLKPK